MSRVVHFEIHAEQPDRAIQFYTACFGWQFSKWDGPIEYWMIRTGPDEQEGINGGLIRRQGTIDGTAVIGYVCTLAVDSVDQSEKAIIANGGTIVVPKMAIPGVGWLVYAKDTDGNIFGIMQNDPSAA